MTSPTLASSFLATLALPVWFAWDPLLPYVTAPFLLVLGMGLAIKNAPPQANWIDKIVLCGPVFIAMPMVVFGMDHYLFPAGTGRIIQASKNEHRVPEIRMVVGRAFRNHASLF
jgi:hypothetical protein